VAEIDQQAELEARGLQIVVYLGSMHFCELRDSFELHDDLVPTNEVGDILPLYATSLVMELEFGFSAKHNPNSISMHS
jgi:hypothetical protein